MIVSQITQLIGVESATVVVARALHLNGAMIANAEIDASGQYTDKGNLTLEIGDLFAKYLHTHDDGVIYGAACDFLNKYTPKKAIEEKEAGKAGYHFSPEFGYKSHEGKVLATIGVGKVTVHGNQRGGAINRDLNAANTLKQPSPMESVKAYFSSETPSVAEFTDNFIGASTRLTEELYDIGVGLSKWLDDSALGKWLESLDDSYEKGEEDKEGQKSNACQGKVKECGEADNAHSNKVKSKVAAEKAKDTEQKQYKQLSNQEKKVADKLTDKRDKGITKMEEEARTIAKDESSSTDEKRLKILQAVARTLRDLRKDYENIISKHPYLALWSTASLNFFMQKVIAGFPDLVDAAKYNLNTLNTEIDLELERTAIKLSKILKHSNPKLNDEDVKTLTACVIAHVQKSPGLSMAMYITNGDVLANARSIAEAVASQLPGRERGLADIYRHLLWGAELRRLYPDFIAKIALETHEIISPDPKYPVANEMDRRNNEIAMQIGKYVQEHGGGWKKVVELSREVLEKSFSGYDINEIESLQKIPTGHKEYGNLYVTSKEQITLSNGLKVDRAVVVHPDIWEKNPKDPITGRKFTIEESNKIKPGFTNNFVYEADSAAEARKEAEERLATKR